MTCSHASGLSLYKVCSHKPCTARLLQIMLPSYTFCCIRSTVLAFANRADTIYIYTQCYSECTVLISICATKRQYHKIRTAKYRISNIAKYVKSVTPCLAASAAFESTSLVLESWKIFCRCFFCRC